MMPGNALSTTPVVSEIRYPVKDTGSAHEDWELGGVALNDPSQGLQVKVWHFELIGDVVTVDGTTLFAAPGTTEIAGCFDQNMNPFVAYRQAGQPKIWWYDPTIAAMTHTTLPADCIDLRCTMDEKRGFNVANSDIVLAYIRNAALCVRYQRDRYTVEYVLQADTGTLHLTYVAMDAGLRLQFKLCGTELPPPPPPAQGLLYALQTSSNVAYRIGYAQWNGTAVEYIASIDFADGCSFGNNTQRPGITRDGNVLTVVPSTWDGTTVAGVYALAPAGSTFTVLDHWATGTIWTSYYGLVSCAGDFIVFANSDLHALSWSGGAISVVTTLNIGGLTANDFISHGTNMVALLSGSTIYVYSYSGAAITFVGSYTQPVVGPSKTPNSLASDGTYIYTDTGLAISTAGGVVALAGQLPLDAGYPPYGMVTAWPGHFAIYNRISWYAAIPANTLAVFSFDGTTATQLDSIACDMPRGNYAMTYASGNIYLADTPDYATTGSVIAWDGTSLTRAANFELPVMTGVDYGCSVSPGQLP